MLATAELSDPRDARGRENRETQGLLDIERAQELGGLGWFWAKSHGCFEFSDQEGRLAVLHAARLLTALNLEIDRDLQALLLHLTSWLTLAEHDGEGPLLARHLSGEVESPSRFERITGELRQRLRSVDLDLSGLVAAIQQVQRAEGDHTGAMAIEERAHRWLSVVLHTLGFLVPDRTPIIHDVEFNVPASWAARVNPLASQVATDVEAWLRDVRVIRDEKGERIFRDLAVAEYAGWPCPSAGYEELWTIAGFFTLWIFHDDVLEGIGARSDEILARAVSGMLELDDPALNNPYVRGWSELGWRLERKMSKRWLSRHYRRFLDWSRAVGNEAETLRRFRQAGTVPQVDEYLELRRRTIGMRPTVGFVEYVLGEELPASVSKLPALSALVDLSADLVAIHNDLLAFSKDLDQRMVNLASCIMAKGFSGERAFRELARLHEQKVGDFEAVARSLLDAVDRRHLPLVGKWITEVQHIIYGFARWHFIAARYSDVHPMEDGSIVRVLLREPAAH